MSVHQALLWACAIGAALVLAQGKSTDGFSAKECNCTKATATGPSLQEPDPVDFLFAPSSQWATWALQQDLQASVLRRERH